MKNQRLSLALWQLRTICTKKARKNHILPGQLDIEDNWKTLENKELKEYAD